MSEPRLRIYDTSNQLVGEATLKEGEVVFPDTHKDFRWVWVLDARHEPYTEMTREELLHRAEHVRKLFVLVEEEDGTPATDSDTDA